MYLNCPEQCTLQRYSHDIDGDYLGSYQSRQQRQQRYGGGVVAGAVALEVDVRLDVGRPRHRHRLQGAQLLFGTGGAVVLLEVLQQHRVAHVLWTLPVGAEVLLQHRSEAVVDQLLEVLLQVAVALAFEAETEAFR